MNRFIEAVFAIVFATVVICIIVGIRPMVIMSGSMEPAISTGSLSFVHTSVSFDNIKKGDIITYNLLDGKVTHRAEIVSGKTIVTKGDANRVSDPGAVTKQNFYGKVLLSIPYAGFVLHYIKRNMLLFLMATVAVIVAISAADKKSMKKGRMVSG